MLPFAFSKPFNHDSKQQTIFSNNQSLLFFNNYIVQNNLIFSCDPRSSIIKEQTNKQRDKWKEKESFSHHHATKKITKQEKKQDSIIFQQPLKKRVPSFHFFRNGKNHEVRAAGIIPFIKRENDTYYLAWVAKKWSQINIPGGKIDFSDITYLNRSKEEIDFEESIKKTALRESNEESNNGLSFLSTADLNIQTAHYLSSSKYIIFPVEIKRMLDVKLLGDIEDTEKGLIEREYVWLPKKEINQLKTGSHEKYKLYFEGIFDFVPDI